MKSRREGKVKSRREKREKKRETKVNQEVDQNGYRDRPKEIGPLQPKTQRQAEMIMAIENNSVVFATGPAGTGKTYISGAMGAEYLKEKSHNLILARPMVGTEDMGHLPGDVNEKYAPWIEPIVQVLRERLGRGHVEAMMRTGRIQAIPLALMRGRSLNDSFIILDEAQNATPEQIKMVLTRLGENSKMVIDGDERQSDLRDRRGVRVESGLSDALHRLSGVRDIDCIEFSREDIVRHGLIKEILRRYEL